MTVKAYIHSLKDHEHDRHMLGEAEIVNRIKDNLYLAEYNGFRCTRNCGTGSSRSLTLCPWALRSAISSSAR